MLFYSFFLIFFHFPSQTSEGNTGSTSQCCPEEMCFNQNVVKESSQHQLDQSIHEFVFSFPVLLLVEGFGGGVWWLKGKENRKVPFLFSLHFRFEMGLNCY